MYDRCNMLHNKWLGKSFLIFHPGSTFSSFVICDAINVQRKTNKIRHVARRRVTIAREPKRTSVS